MQNTEITMLNIEINAMKVNNSASIIIWKFVLVLVLVAILIYF